MNKRRSTCKLLGKLGLVSFYSPTAFSSIITLKEKLNQKEIKINLDFLQSSFSTPNFKLKPGEKIKISLVCKAGFSDSYRTILFQMPLISLRPHVLFDKNKKDLKLPLVVFSSVGKPLRDN